MIYHRTPTHARRLHHDKPARLARRSKGLSTAIPIVLLGMVFAFGFLYVAQSNSSATGALEIRQLQRQVASLKSETQDLALTAAQLRALDTVQAATKDLNLLVVAPVQTLPPATSAVAVAR